MKLDNAKTFRLLNLYERLNRGETVNKKDFANAFGISEKSVQRDIDDLRVYLAECYENGDDITVEYSYVKNGYYLVKKDKEFLTNEEILGISKILLESRAYNRDELEGLIDKLLLQATPLARMNIKEMILNEKFHYIPLKHNKPLLNAIWELKEMAEGYFIINIPEIHIPAYKIEVDMSDKDTLSNWEKITAHLEALGDYVEKPKDKITCEEISKPIDDLINNIYSQLIDAEEKYTELKDQEGED